MYNLIVLVQRGVGETWHEIVAGLSYSFSTELEARNAKAIFEGKCCCTAFILAPDGTEIKT